MIFAAILTFACGGEQSKQPSSQQEAPTKESEPAQPVEESKDSEAADTGEQEEPGDCVKTCVASRQMQATSVEQIEADCQAQCAAEADKP